MNTPADQEPEDLRYAEYVLGVLDADARTAVEREITANPRAAAEVARWQRHLSSLAEDVSPIAAPAHVWARIEAALGIPVSRKSGRSGRSGWWGNLALWRGLALGAGVVAAACIIALVWLPRAAVAPVPAAVPTASYMASRITQSNGQVGWTATMDVAQARMLVVPASPERIPADRAPELWLIARGQKPVAVGMISTRVLTAIPLDRKLLARLGPSAALAVSVEPPGGSPTGQPTGPVIAKGNVNGI